MTDEPGKPITVFSCPPGATCDHVWDGPGLEILSDCSKCEGTGKMDGVPCLFCDGRGTWVSGESSTCSKCGMDAMTWSLWNGP